MTDKPNYNDGNWHGWNGGECPVHPKTVIAVLWRSPPLDHIIRGVVREAGEFQDACWHHAAVGPANIEFFRVIKEHREPREFWLCRDGSNDRFGVSFTAPTAHWNEVIHVSEVLK